MSMKRGSIGVLDTPLTLILLQHMSNTTHKLNRYPVKKLIFYCQRQGPNKFVQLLLKQL